MSLKITPPPRMPDLRYAPEEIAKWRAFLDWMRAMQQWSAEMHAALAELQKAQP